MANPDRPSGFVPVQYLNGSPWSGQTRLYSIPAAYGTALYIGDDVHDRSAPRTMHRFRDGLRAEKGTQRVDPPEPLDIGRLGVDERLHMKQTGIVHEYRRRTEEFDRLRDDFGPALLIGHIEPYEGSALADVLRDRPALGLEDIRENDPGTFLNEESSDLFAGPAGGTRDDGDFSFETRGHGGSRVCGGQPER